MSSIFMQTIEEKLNVAIETDHIKEVKVFLPQLSLTI